MKFTILSILIVAAVASARVHSKAPHGSLVAAVATGTQQQNFGSALEAFMLAFQRIMPCGSAKLGIPALAPFKLPFYPLQHETQYLKLNGNFSNIVIGGANSFQVLAGSYDTTTNHLTYDFIYPEMQVLAENVLDIWALVAGYPMQLSAEGLINIRITDFRIVGSFDVIQNPSNPKGLQIANFNMRFYIGDIVFNNWNKLWNIAGNNFANKMAREAVLEWAEQIQGDVDAIYDALVLPLVNDALADVNMTQVVDWFMEEAQIFDSVPCTLSGNTL